MNFKFEKLEVWKRSMDLAEDLHQSIYSWPDIEKFNLSSQTRRAMDSIALNIAEGSIGQTNPEFRKFLGYSIRSLAEVVTCIHKAKRRDYINEEAFEKFDTECFNLMNMLQAFRKSIK